LSATLVFPFTSSCKSPGWAGQENASVCIANSFLRDRELLAVVAGFSLRLRLAQAEACGSRRLKPAARAGYKPRAAQNQRLALSRI
jgi:hypothetical protein